MAISEKLVKVDLITDVAEDYTKELKKKVDAEEGKGLIETEKVTKLDEIEAKAQVNKVEGIQINGTDLVPDGESKIVNITAKDLAPDLEGYVQDSELTEQLTPYLKSTDAESTYLKSETAETTYLKSADADGKFATIEDVANLGDLKGSCLKADLEDKKAECKANDMYIVTDDDNHIYFYNGTDWTDTSAKAHVDLEPYMKTADADNKFAEKTTVETLQSTVTGLEGSLKEEDLKFATQEDVLAAIQAGKAKVTG